ncbi:MAG: hypothetical protein DCC49_01115 [Acidobacteria bacterium]|nr:MAG: hypothetical protein DCC49_01115 [Acidobacteriota bacterium]
MGFLRGGLLDNEIKEVVVSVLRRGPRPIADLTQDVAEQLDRPGLRVGQLTPIVLRLSEKGYVKVGGRGQGRICSLTLSGHEMARSAATNGERGAGEADAVERAGTDQESEEVRRSEIEQFVAAVCESALISVSPKNSEERA